MNDLPPHIVLTLPLPPSANRMWHVNRRVKVIQTINGVKRRLNVHLTPEYKRWLDAAGQYAVLQAHGDTVPYRYEMRVTLPATRRDVDNYMKPIGDMLQRCRIVQNDKHAQAISVRIDPHREADTVLIELWALPGDPPPPVPPRPRKLPLFAPKPRAPRSQERITAAELRKLLGSR